jgi:hypothetical protein
MRARFSTEIKQGRVKIENLVVSSNRTGIADFFIPLEGITGLSDHHSTFKDPETLPEPFKGRHKYKKVSLRSARASEIVSKHGKPYYIKIDIEHADADILAELFRAGHRAKYISAESHSIRVLAELVANGKYNLFKLVEGFSVSELYRNRIFDPEKKRLKKASKPRIKGLNSSSNSSLQAQHSVVSFQYGSAGPFGEDIDGPWLSADELFQKLAVSGLGWKDIHAKRIKPKQRT